MHTHTCTIQSYLRHDERVALFQRQVRLLRRIFLVFLTLLSFALLFLAASAVFCGWSASPGAGRSRTAARGRRVGTGAGKSRQQVVDRSSNERLGCSRDARVGNVAVRILYRRTHNGRFMYSQLANSLVVQIKNKYKP